MNARRLLMLLCATLLLGACTQADPAAAVLPSAAPSKDGGVMMGSGNSTMEPRPQRGGSMMGSGNDGTEGGVMLGSGTPSATVARDGGSMMGSGTVAQTGTEPSEVERGGVMMGSGN